MSDFIIRYKLDCEFTIYSEDIMKDMDDEDLMELYYEVIADHFEQNITQSGMNENEFIAWAKDVVKT